MTHPQKQKEEQQHQQQQNLSGTASPLTIKFGVHELAVNNPESKESKVGKAAQYWNNYIGEVISKSKPVHPDSVKSLVCSQDLFVYISAVCLCFYL